MFIKKYFVVPAFTLFFSTLSFSSLADSDNPTLDSCISHANGSKACKITKKCAKQHISLPGQTLICKISEALCIAKKNRCREKWG